MARLVLASVGVNGLIAQRLGNGLDTMAMAKTNS